MFMSAVEAQRFEDTATDAEFDAYLAASDAAEQPSCHPDQFRHLILVMLPHHPKPVPAVATIGVDGRLEPELDDVWVYMPGRLPERKLRGDTFRRVRREMVGEHYVELRRRAAELRVA